MRQKRVAAMMNYQTIDLNICIKDFSALAHYQQLTGSENSEQSFAKCVPPIMLTILWFFCWGWNLPPRYQSLSYIVIAGNSMLFNMLQRH